MRSILVLSICFLFLVSLSGNVSAQTSVQTGMVNDGETIPLPTGYTQEQCDWTVSIYFVEDMRGWYDYLRYQHYWCSANSSRGVECGTKYYHDSTWHWIPGKANYMIVCTNDDLSSRVDALENETVENSQRIDSLESLISSVESTLNDFIAYVNDYISGLPRGLRE